MCSQELMLHGQFVKKGFVRMQVTWATYLTRTQMHTHSNNIIDVVPTAFVTTLLYNVSVDLWTGLTSDSKGHFQWAQPGLLSYTNWGPGEPLDNSGPLHNKTPVHTTTLPLYDFQMCQTKRDIHLLFCFKETYTKE